MSFGAVDVNLRYGRVVTKFHFAWYSSGLYSG